MNWLDSSLFVGALAGFISVNSCELTHHLTVGEYCRIRGIDQGHVAIACKTQQEYADWMKAASERDVETVGQLYLGDRGTALADNLRVRVLAINDKVVQVLVLEGVNSGWEVWLSADRLRPE